MYRVISLFGVSQAAQTLVHNLLQVRLAHIDHRDNLFSMAKAHGVGLFACLNVILWSTHCPEHAPISLATPGNEMELDAYLWIISQTKLPELVSNIFGRIGGSAITSDEYLITCMVAFFC